jgi:hypothetical protein
VQTVQNTLQGVGGAIPNPGGAVGSLPGGSGSGSGSGSGGNDDEDLSSIPGSQVAPSNCQRVLAGTGFRRQQVAGVGTIRLRVVASAYISRKNPLRLVSQAPRSRVRSMAYLLDRHTVARARTSRYTLTLSPAQLARTARHVVAIRIKPRKGPAHRMTLKIRTAPCANVLSAFQWKTGTGTGLRLRVDSRTALQRAAFAVRSAMLPKAKDAGHAIGHVRIFLAGGKKISFTLRLAKGDRSKTLLRAASDAPQIALAKRGLTVKDLPRRVGIVEITLYTRNRTSPRALLRKRTRARLGATVTEKGRSFRLKTVVRAQRH